MERKKEQVLIKVGALEHSLTFRPLAIIMSSLLVLPPKTPSTRRMATPITEIPAMRPADGEKEGAGVEREAEVKEGEGGS